MGVFGFAFLKLFFCTDEPVDTHTRKNIWLIEYKQPEKEVLYKEEIVKVTYLHCRSVISWSNSFSLSCAASSCGSMKNNSAEF